MFAGYLVFRNVLSLVPTVVVAILGTFCGIVASYMLGRMSGTLIQRFDSRGRLRMVRRFLERFGRWTLVFGYLIPGLRNVTGLTAGASKLRFAWFAPLALGGAVLSSTVCVTVGYVFGPHAEWLLLAIERNLLLALVAFFTV